MVTAARGSSTNPFWTSFQRTAKLDRAVADSGRILNFSALLAKFQYPFCLARISFLLYNPIVFRSKALPQFLGAALAHCEKQDSSHGDYSDDDNYNQELSLIHAPPVQQCVAMGYECQQGCCREGFLQLWPACCLRRRCQTPSGHYTKPIPA